MPIELTLPGGGRLQLWPGTATPTGGVVELEDRLIADMHRTAGTAKTARLLGVSPRKVNYVVKRVKERPGTLTGHSPKGETETC